MNKETIKRIAPLLSIIVVTGIMLLFIGKTLGDPNSTVLKDQVIGNIEFKNANIEYSEGISTLTLEVINKGEDLSLKYIEILVEQENETYPLIL